MNICKTPPQSDALSVSVPAVLDLQQRLTGQLGQEIHLGDWYQLDQRCIERFAHITGDDQWIHVDVERARRESPFRGTVAQGFLILSLLPTLRALDKESACSYPDARLVVNCGLNEVSFLHPVKADSQIRSRTRLLELVANKRSLDIIEENRVEIQGSEKCACIAQTRVRVYV